MGARLPGGHWQQSLGLRRVLTAHLSNAAVRTRARTYTRSFVPPPNVRALRLDVHFEQGADSTVMCALARPFAPHLEHLCLKIAACGEEHDGWFDIIEFWSDRTAAALLVLCPHLRRLDFPLEVCRRLRPRRACRGSSAPPRPGAPG